MKNDIIDYFPNIDPFLLRKWEHAFVTFFDVNHNGVLEWEDFQLLIEVIKAMRGADSDVYRTADVALKEIWNRLIEETHIVSSDHLIRTTRSHQSLKPQISLLNWIAMWQRTLNGEETLWQKHYLEYMFKLIDASGDKLIDLAEYMEVLSYYNIGRMEAVTCFDKIAKTPEGSQKMAINYSEFCSLWDEYFNSTDLNASGNYLLGYV